DLIAWIDPRGIACGGQSRGGLLKGLCGVADSLAQFGLAPGARPLVGFAEPDALDDPAGGGDAQRGHDADADDARDEVHRWSQDTIGKSLGTDAPAQTRRTPRRRQLANRRYSIRRADDVSG